MRHDPQDIEELDDERWSEKYQPSGAGVSWAVIAIGTVVAVAFAYWLING